MTIEDRQSYRELTPADGVETTARRMIDDAGAPIESDEVYKYIRVIGSKITNLEPHFWGDGMAIAKYPGNRGRPDHYYVSSALKRIEILVCKRASTEKEAIRKAEFTDTTGLWKYLRKDQVTPWQEIPEKFGRQRYLMYLCEEKPDLLRKVGYPQSSIDACARGDDLGQPCHEDGSPIIREGKVVAFEVHHRVPLQGGGSNAIGNLCLVEKGVHNPFFHKGDDPKLNKMKKEEVRKIALTVPNNDIDVIAVGLNVQVFIDKSHSKEGSAA